MSVRLAASPALAVSRRDTVMAETYPRNNELANYDVFPGGQHFVFIGNSRTDGVNPIVIRTNWHVKK